MTGRIRSFVPFGRCGIVQADNGDELWFSMPLSSPDLHGGDIVEFDVGQEDRPLAQNVRLQHRWAEMLNEHHRPLVNAFHDTVNVYVAPSKPGG